CGSRLLRALLASGGLRRLSVSLGAPCCAPRASSRVRLRACETCGRVPCWSASSPAVACNRVAVGNTSDSPWLSRDRCFRSGGRLAREIDAGAHGGLTGAKSGDDLVEAEPVDRDDVEGLRGLRGVDVVKAA